MTTESRDFSLPRKEEVYEKYIGEYYICSPVGTTEKYVGKIKKIDTKEGKITFNPYFGSTYDKKSELNLYSLIEHDYDTFIDLRRISFEPTTKEGILHNCGLGNRGEINQPKSVSFFERFKLAYRILRNKSY